MRAVPSDGSLDIVAIAEAWLSDKDDDVLLTGDTDFRFFRGDRLCDKSRGGEVPVLVRNRISGVLCLDVTSYPGFRFMSSAGLQAAT